MTASSTGLTFGIYPFSMAGMASGVAAGPPDDLQRLPGIIERLRGGRNFLLRTYAPYAGSESVPGIYGMLDLCAVSNMAWDFVLTFRAGHEKLDGWLQVIRDIVARHGKTLNTLQITNEPNLTHAPDAGDGSQPQVREALVQGVLAAKDARQAAGATVKIGFNAVPRFNPQDGFWASLPKIDPAIAKAIDYAGFDFYPDVFGDAIALENLPAAVERLLRDFRTRDLPAAGISADVPLRICETGWPTGPQRSYERQALVLESVIRTVHRLRSELNITHYELFGLRDADSGNDNLCYQFGIMRDDYTPKPAFEVYRDLIRELGR